MVNMLDKLSALLLSHPRMNCGLMGKAPSGLGFWVSQS
jgi:hypothetical protein